MNKFIKIEFTKEIYENYMKIMLHGKRKVVLVIILFAIPFLYFTVNYTSSYYHYHNVTKLNLGSSIEDIQNAIVSAEKLKKSSFIDDANDYVQSLSNKHRLMNTARNDFQSIKSLLIELEHILDIKQGVQMLMDEGLSEKDAYKQFVDSTARAVYENSKN